VAVRRIAAMLKKIIISKIETGRRMSIRGGTTVVVKRYPGCLKNISACCS
jgi:hypothetical protein